MKRILLIVTILLSGEVIAANADIDTIQKKFSDALCYLQGLNRPFYPEKAYDIFLELADEGVSKAMNAVAIMYAEGIGIDKNYISAYSWFERAAMSGYYKAYYNMALLWKYGYGVEQDDIKARECCIKGADHGDPDCKYALGYMSFKGLACKQDYKKALEIFLEAAAGGNMAASYMIGICYRNGYGIRRDEAEANYWLMKSSTGGNIRAARELASEEPENHIINGSLTYEIMYENLIPETFKEVEFNVVDKDLTGTYTGYIVTYDWSGEYVIGLNSLELDLENNNNIINGLWIEADTGIAEINGTINDSALIFTNVKYDRMDHYHGRPILFYFKSADLHITETDSITWLSGNIQFFSEVTMEPEKPMYISLKRRIDPVDPEISEKQDKPITDLRVFPNPFRDKVNISFSLKEESEVSVMIYTIDGRKLYQAEPGKLNSGVNIQNLSLTVPQGIYLVKVICGSDSETTMIVK